VASRDDVLKGTAPTFQPVPGVVIPGTPNLATGDGTKFLADDGTYKAVPVFSPTTYRKTTAKTVNTSTTATDLLNGEITIPANKMGTTGVLRLTAGGDFVNNSGGAVVHPQFQLIFGGTTLIDTSRSGTTAAGATRGGWRIKAEIFNLGAANAQMTCFQILLATPQGTVAFPGAQFATGEGYIVGINQAGSATNTGLLVGEGVNTSTAVDTTADQTLVLNVINGSASASYETKLVGAFIDIV
jgi:hypothetical protein